MDYTIDIGNSRIKTACFTPAGNLMTTRGFDRNDWSEISRDLTNLGVENIIYSTVANEPPQEWIAAQTTAKRKIWSLDRAKPLPFASSYQTMTTVGKDRLAAVAGALSLYPGENCLVVDAGTCVTFDLLTQAGIYRGGNISPGVQMRLRSMHEQTVRLPLVAVAPLTGVLGNSTETALRQGGQGGVGYELEGLYQRLAAEWAPLNVVLTGGDAELLAKDLRLSYNLQPNLVHIGLHKIMTFYAEATV